MGKWDINASKDLVDDPSEQGWLIEEGYKHAFALIERGKSRKWTRYALKQTNRA